MQKESTVPPQYPVSYCIETGWTGLPYSFYFWWIKNGATWAASQTDTSKRKRQTTLYHKIVACFVSLVNEMDFTNSPGVRNS